MFATMKNSPPARTAAFAAAFATFAAAATPVPARADAIGQGLDLMFAGYGELTFAWLDYGADQNRQHGAKSDSRLEFDQTRFVLELEAEFPAGFEFESEIEFEHGGTGSAMELEYEEFGEFEHEVERGGEVVLEELYLQKVVGDWLRLRLGRFYVAVGLLSERFRPTQYLAASRSEAETTLLPAVWDEMGFDAQVTLGDFRLTAQVVNGLDSTGFSTRNFIAGGHQQRFEVVRASDLAGVLRLDYTPMTGLTLGVSGYHGGTSRNRPKPDLAKACPGGDQDEIAPCGYVSAPVTILDFHTHLTLGGFRGQGAFILGKLGEAERVSERNARLSNLLGVPRTPVADSALAAWVEAGYDIGRLLGTKDHQIEPFVRLDYVDTIFSARKAMYDDPRFEKSIYTGGVAWTGYDLIVAKLDFSHRRMGADRFRPESVVRLNTGFVY